MLKRLGLILCTLLLAGAADAEVVMSVKLLDAVTTTGASRSIDTKDVPATAWILVVSTAGEPTGCSIALQESDDDGSGDAYASVTASVGTANPLTCTTTGQISYFGYARYLRANLSTLSGGTAPTVTAWLIGVLDPGVVANISGRAATDAPVAANPVYIGAYAEADAAALVTVDAEGDMAPLRTDLEGRLFVRDDSPNRIACQVAVSTATTIQAVGGDCAAPGANTCLYVTDVSFGTSAAAGTAADSFPTLKYGTDGTCGTGTAIFWQALTTANSTVSMNYRTPFRVPANNEICWIMTTAGSKTVNIKGYKGAC